MKKWLLFKENALITLASIVALAFFIPGILLYWHGALLGAIGCEVMEAAENKCWKWRRQRLRNSL